MSAWLPRIDRAPPRQAIEWVLAVALFYWLTGDPTTAAAVGALFLPLGLRDAGVIDPWSATLAFGVILVVIGGYGLVGRRMVWAVLPVSIVAIGAWIVLDSLRRWRTGADGRDRPPNFPDDPDSSDVVLWVATANRVLRALGADVPRTAGELSDSLALDERRVEAALAHLDRTRAVEERAGGYVAVERYRGRFGTVRRLAAALPSAARRVVERLGRPFRPSGWRS